MKQDYEYSTTGTLTGVGLAVFAIFLILAVIL